MATEFSSIRDIMFPQAKEETTLEESALQEESKTASVIAELIKTSWSGSNDEQMKAVQLLKGVALSDDDAANKFMKALDKFTSAMNADDFK